MSTHDGLLRYRRFFCLAAAMLVLPLAGCALLADHNEETFSTGPSPSADARDVVVLFDGTGNDDASRTNVFEMREALRHGTRPVLLDYIPGVGTASTLDLLGTGLGFKMEEDVHKGYRFISANARPQDRILIFGFSRGAHEARALAGLIAYAGLFDTAGLSDRKQLVEANRVLEMTKKFDDVPMMAEFVAHPDVPPLLVKAQSDLGLKMRIARIDFLGIWDTVPGSAFKHFEKCRELDNSVQGERYKTGSYPLIRRIAHAMSLDEKRSRFYPILACAPMVPEQTVVHEMWFAGAHADVGGGYPEGSLQTISMDWMADEMRDQLGFRPNVATPGNPVGLAHWSFGTGASSFRSNCEDRLVPANAVIHPSVARRIEAGQAPVLINGVERVETYPRHCDK